jgi:YegS/Rv2252/BmrU family lipid kinase
MTGSPDNGRESSGHRAFIVLNPIAGHASADEIRSTLDRFLVERGWSCEVYETTGEENVAELTRNASKEEYDLIVAAGGDGTVAGVVNGLVQSDIPLGVVPVGTGNGLARALGVPLELERAIELLAGEHRIVEIDALQVGEEYYILNVSAGISGKAMRKTEPEQKRRFGMLAYVWTILQETLGFRPRPFRIQVDGRNLQVRATEILVSNGALLKESPVPLGTPESYGDGQFDVYIITARTALDYIRILWDLILKPVEDNPDLHNIVVKQSIRIEAMGAPQPVQADGETLGQTPVEVKVARGAVRVITPVLEETPDEEQLKVER